MLSKAIVVGAYQRKLEELARLPDMELTVLAPPRWRDSRGEVRLQPVYTAGYRLIPTPIALNGHFHTHFYPRLGAALRASRPDVLHIDEEPYNTATWQALRWAAARHVPALFFTWQNLARRYPPPFRWIESYTYRHSAHAIAGNQEAEAVLRSKGYRGPVSVIPQFGIDPHLFQRHAQPPLLPHDPSRFTVGYAGGLAEEKGVDTLLHALHLPRQAPAAQGDARRWRIVLVGEGPAQAALQRLAVELDLQDDVQFLGRLGSTHMPAFYASLDALVLPSRTRPNWKEQFGRVLIEAMACETPVVGSDSGEIPHVIGDAGLVFAEGDATALASCLRRLAGDAALHAALACAGRVRVLERFTQAQVAAATVDVYRTLLG